MKSSIEPDVNVFVTVYQDGKVIQTQIGHNVLTDVGREYFAQRCIYDVSGNAYRQDLVDYIGFGTGSQAESRAVTSLVTPTEFTLGTFLAQVDRTLTSFPLSPSRTTVRLGKVFDLLEISYAGSVDLTEVGLFTDGDPGSSYAPGTRDTTIANASAQAPLAYHAFANPIPKNSNVQLEIAWELIF